MIHSLAEERPRGEGKLANCARREGQERIGAGGCGQRGKEAADLRRPEVRAPVDGRSLGLDDGPHDKCRLHACETLRARLQVAHGGSRARRNARDVSGLESSLEKRTHPVRITTDDDEISLCVDEHKGKDAVDRASESFRVA